MRINELLKAARELEDETELDSVMVELNDRAHEMTPKQLEQYASIYIEVRKSLRQVLS